MGELMGTLRPVKQHERAQGAGARYTVEPLGEVNASVRYREIEDLGIIEVIDEATLPFTDASADGFALYDQGGELLAWWQIVGTPDQPLELSAGWGFKAHPTAQAEQAERAATAAL